MSRSVVATPVDDEGVRAMTDTTDVVSYEVVDRVAHVTIERPAKRNAMSLEVFDQLTSRAVEVAADPEVGAVVVAGRGGSFSAGIDLSIFGNQVTDGLDPAFVARLQAAFTAYEDLDVPTIAAVEGHCYGAGIQLAAACHLRAVAPSAEFSVMEARWGLIPDLGGSWRLPRLVGLGRATELVLTARKVDGEEALAIGLGEYELPEQDPQEAAHAWASRLAAGPGALRLVPRLLRENLERDRTAALQAEVAAQQRASSGPDFREAVTAHLESRPPRFVGR
jgi:enoyl-CoA hydratase/carnithine racemase